MDLGHYRGAVECYDAALEVHPGNLVAGKNRGEAIQALRRSMTVGEWVRWGLSHFERGHYGRANECYDIALELDPANPVALKSKAMVLDRQGKRRRGDRRRGPGRSRSIGPGSEYGFADRHAVSTMTGHGPALRSDSDAIAASLGDRAAGATSSWSRLPSVGAGGRPRTGQCGGLS